MIVLIRSFALSVMGTMLFFLHLLYKDNQNKFQIFGKSSEFCQISPSLYICQIGEASRICVTARFICCIARSISSFVVYLLKLKRLLQTPSSSSIPIALSTGDGSREPETQAEPDDRAISGTLVINSVDRTCLINTLLVFGMRSVPLA